jgi:hypothetical protein
MAVSRTMWLRGIQMDAAQMRRNAVDEKNAKTKEITGKWREGFAVLKAENDRLQLEASLVYKTEVARIDASVKQWIAEGPPKD